MLASHIQSPGFDPQHPINCHASNPSTEEGAGGGLEDQDPPQLNREIENSLSNRSLGGEDSQGLELE